MHSGSLACTGAWDTSTMNTCFSMTSHLLAPSGLHSTVPELQNHAQQLLDIEDVLVTVVSTITVSMPTADANSEISSSFTHDGKPLKILEEIYNSQPSFLPSSLFSSPLPTVLQKHAIRAALPSPLPPNDGGPKNGDELSTPRPSREPGNWSPPSGCIARKYAKGLYTACQNECECGWRGLCVHDGNVDESWTCQCRGVS